MWRDVFEDIRKQKEASEWLTEENEMYGKADKKAGKT